MANIFLIRHGQASFGAENYDQLSALGYRQTKLLGEFCARQSLKPAQIITGAMARHAQSYQSFCQGFGADLTRTINADYNEFDHEQVLLVASGAKNKTELGALLLADPNPKAKLYTMFSAAVARWQSAEFDSDYSESWIDFKNRAHKALHATLLGASCDENIFVFTSGGVIACIVGQLLGLADAQVFAINFSIANASITKIKNRSQGPQLLSFNEFSFLESETSELLSWH